MNKASCFARSIVTPLDCQAVAMVLITVPTIPHVLTLPLYLLQCLVYPTFPLLRSRLPCRACLYYITWTTHRQVTK